MKIIISRLDGATLVELSGVVGSTTSGHLYDTLTRLIGAGDSRLILDLSRVERLTRAGARGLIVAAKLMQTRRGEMRICGAEADVEAALQDLGFRHLLRSDPDLGTALAALSQPAPAAETGPGLTLQEEADRLRVDMARSLVEEGELPLDRIAMACGYRGTEIMHREFLRHFGIPPSAYAPARPQTAIIYDAAS